MPRWDSSNNSWLAQYIEHETRHLDLVASWERLVAIYESMHFVDEMTDRIRLEEFKWIIRETNKFLTRCRNQLQTPVKNGNPMGVINYLMSQYSTKDSTNIDTRQALVYSKLKQDWIYQTALKLQTMMENMNEEENQNGSDDWTDDR